MSNAIKGKKGYQKIDESIRKDKRVTVKFTLSEYDKLKTYVKENGLTLSDLIRDRLKDVIS